MAYGYAAGAVNEYLRLGESSALLCLEKFVDRIIYLFQDTYLRRPTPEDFQRLLNQGEARGFFGMIGSIDCMHWEWKNCHTAWKCQYSCGSGKPTIVLEVVASQNLWIWHVFFGTPCTLNDINVLDRSPVFDDILEGRAPRVDYFVIGQHYNMSYYLTDGIYPKWATFIQSISIPQDPKILLFAQCQEAVRKDVERAFGVLQARFAIVKNHVLTWDKTKNRKDNESMYHIVQYDSRRRTRWIRFVQCIKILSRRRKRDFTREFNIFYKYAYQSQQYEAFEIDFVMQHNINN